MTQIPAFLLSRYEHAEAAVCFMRRVSLCKVSASFRHLIRLKLTLKIFAESEWNLHCLQKQLHFKVFGSWENYFNVIINRLHLHGFILGIASAARTPDSEIRLLFAHFSVLWVICLSGRLLRQSSAANTIWLAVQPALGVITVQERVQEIQRLCSFSEFSASYYITRGDGWKNRGGGTSHKVKPKRLSTTSLLIETVFWPQRRAATHLTFSPLFHLMYCTSSWRVNSVGDHSDNLRDVQRVLIFRRILFHQRT